MSETEPMSVNERRKYLHKMRIRYWQAKSQSAKSALLDEMEAVTTLHRKSLIRLIKGELARKPRRKLSNPPAFLSQGASLENHPMVIFSRAFLGARR